MVSLRVEGKFFLPLLGSLIFILFLFNSSMPNLILVGTMCVPKKCSTGSHMYGGVCTSCVTSSVATCNDDGTTKSW